MLLQARRSIRYDTRSGSFGKRIVPRTLNRYPRNARHVGYRKAGQYLLWNGSVVLCLGFFEFFFEFRETLGAELLPLSLDPGLFFSFQTILQLGRWPSTNDYGGPIYPIPSEFDISKCIRICI